MQINGLNEFLETNGFDIRTLDWLPADASARRYGRLQENTGSSAIVMVAPPDLSLKTEEFKGISSFLLTRGFAVPEFIATDDNQGFYVLTDLGTDDVPSYLERHEAAEQRVYETALQVLLQLKGLDTPHGLEVLTPEKAGEMVKVSCECYLRDPEPSDRLAEIIKSGFHQFCDEKKTLALRDFHVENLIWRDDQTGIQKLGLLDFQDAFIAPDGYDLASLVRDARRDMPSKLRENLINDFAHQIGRNPEHFRRQVAMLSIQRNLRILGVFARLILQHKKEKYRAFLPRTHCQLTDELDILGFEPLETFFKTFFPTPDALGLAHA